MMCDADYHEFGLAGGNHLRFMKRVAGAGVMEGTTNEEVLEMLIARLRHLNSKVPCRENAFAITKLQEALMWLHERTKQRVEQGVEMTDKPHLSA